MELSQKILRKNIQLIVQGLPKGVHYFCVIKGHALGHNAILVAKEALAQGADYLMVSCVKEALDLVTQGIRAPIFILYERFEEELELCIIKNFTLQLQSLRRAQNISVLAAKQNKRVKVHLKVDTGLGRYGVHWSKAADLFEKILSVPYLELEGIMTHFAQSDELDKTYAKLQATRFQKVLRILEKKNILPKYIHCCNTGGYLDLPDYYYSAVRVGILNTGVYPSRVCKRIFGIAPVMNIKTRVAHIKIIKTGEKVGYGMNYTATEDTKVAVLPIGYGDGFPRLKNQGRVLLCGQFAYIIGGVSMDTTMIKIQNIPQAKVGDEVVILGKQKEKEITINDLSEWYSSVVYHQFTSWSCRVKRIII